MKFLSSSTILLLSTFLLNALANPLPEANPDANPDTTPTKASSFFDRLLGRDPTPVSAARRQVTSAFGAITIQIYGTTSCGAHLQDIFATPGKCYNTKAAFSSWEATGTNLDESLVAWSNPGCAGSVVETSVPAAGVCRGGFGSPGASFRLG